MIAGILGSPGVAAVVSAPAPAAAAVPALPAALVVATDAVLPPLPLAAAALPLAPVVPPDDLSCDAGGLVVAVLLGAALRPAVGATPDLGTLVCAELPADMLPLEVDVAALAPEVAVASAGDAASALDDSLVPHPKLEMITTENKMALRMVWTFQPNAIGRSTVQKAANRSRPERGDRFYA